jgi:hypothetical protein
LAQTSCMFRSSVKMNLTISLFMLILLTSSRQIINYHCSPSESLCPYQNQVTEVSVWLNLLFSVTSIFLLWNLFIYAEVSCSTHCFITVNLAITFCKMRMTFSPISHNI